MHPASSERSRSHEALAHVLRNHREAIAAMDFFTVPTLTFGVRREAPRVRAPSEPRAHLRAVRARVENCISPYKQETNSLPSVLKLLSDTGISFGRGNTHVHLQPA